MSLTTDELLHLAKLSRLSMDEQTFETFRPQLEGILEYIGRLQSVEVPPSAEREISAEAIVRQDIPVPSAPDLLQDLQAAFPDRSDKLLRVPGVFDKPKD